MNEISRQISTSPQRLRNLLRLHGRPDKTLTAKLNDTATRQIGVAGVAKAMEIATQVSQASANGGGMVHIPPTPPNVITQPDTVGPLPAFLLKPKASKPMATTPTTKQATYKALTFADRLKSVTKKIDADLESGIETLEALEASAAEVTAKVAGIVAQKVADVGTLTNVLNQLTNGAPDDEPEAEPEAEPETPAEGTQQTTQA